LTSSTALTASFEEFPHGLPHPFASLAQGHGQGQQSTHGQHSLGPHLVVAKDPLESGFEQVIPFISPFLKSWLIEVASTELVMRQRAIRVLQNFMLFLV